MESFGSCELHTISTVLASIYSQTPDPGPNVSQTAYRTGIQYAEGKHQPLTMPFYLAAGKLLSIEKNSPPLPGRADCFSG